MKNFLLLLASTTLFLSACASEVITPIAPITENIISSDFEPNYVKTLNAQGVQTPSIENIYRFGKVNNILYRGGLPTDQDLEALKKFGVKTIVSFRGLGDPTEQVQIDSEKKVTTKLGMKFLNIQIPFDKPVPETTIKAFFKAVNDKKNQPLYVHCKGGRDRTGTMVALYRIQYENFKPAQAVEEMKQYTFNPIDYPIFTNQIMNFKPFTK